MIQQATGPQEDLLTILKRLQIAVVWTCLLFIRSDQNHLARHSERGKKTRQTEEKVGRQHQGMDRPGVRQVPEGNGEQGKMEETGCEIICGAPMNLEVKGSMMMMMNAISPPRLGSTSLCSWLSPGKGMQISHGRNPIGAIVVKKKKPTAPPMVLSKARCGCRGQS